VSVNFLDNLVAQKILSVTDAEKIKKQAASNNESIIRTLQGSGLVDGQKLLAAEGSFFGIEEVELSRHVINKETLNILPQDLAENYELVAFKKQGDIISIALADPGNFKAREAVEFFARKNNLKIKYYITSFKGLGIAQKQYSTLKSEVGEALDVAKEKFEIPSEDAVSKKGEEFEEVIKSAPVAKMTSVILRHAIDGRASDIHIEPMEDKTRVRYRVDGSLHTSLTLPKYIHAALISRIKVLAGLKIDETRIPQDGHIRQKDGKNKIDLRVSTIPLSEGEKVVMRILEVTADPPSLEDLGFVRRNFEAIKRNIKKPHGMFLVTGPTGSGKSTTLFSILNILNKEQVNICTLEDPVEYHVEGVNQSQVNPEVNFTFASGLRALLRQDPDIVMVGEIRDNETAELAIHAALTGHFVLSTLHTNDAFGAIPRFIDMKAEPFLLVSTLNIIIAQRLVRRLCEHCKEEFRAPENITGEVKIELQKISNAETLIDLNPKNPVFYKGKGCPRCNNLGTQGRLAIAEVLEMTPQLKEVILNGSKPAQAEAEIKRQGMLTIRQDGILKAMQGFISIEEVFSVTSED